MPLPIDPVLPEAVATLRRHNRLVLEAPPGAGKTTRLPRALLDSGMLERGDALVLEPRRLAARLAARRVAEELGEPVGARVGYQLRFEGEFCAETRVRFVTEGILTRRLLHDPTLRGTAVVVLDEFHERHLPGDVALALLRRLQRSVRPDLAVVVMSATLGTAPIAEFLGAPSLRAEGRRFSVDVEHAERSDDRPLSLRVAGALRRLVREGLDGDVLVFLPGASEIRAAAKASEELAREADLVLLPLHGALPPDEQDRAVARSTRRKVILSTNVAESSVTIDGVVAVIDSGLARVASHSPWSGLPTLQVGRVARASAIQRAGRAGRTRDGRCLRLYTHLDFASRPEHDTPEISRADLAELVLELSAIGVPHPETLEWLDAPPVASLAAAKQLLTRLGALEAGAPSAIGRRMLDFPVHPRLGRVVVEGERRGAASRACRVAALVSERDLRLSTPGDFTMPRGRLEGSSDLFERLATFDEAERLGASRDDARRLGLDPARVASAREVARRLASIARRGRGEAADRQDVSDEALATCVLVGFPDRVGRLRRPKTATTRAGLEVVFAGGGSAVLADDSPWPTELVVAVDVEDRRDGRGGRPVVRLASPVAEDALLDIFTDVVVDATEVSWNPGAERVEVIRSLSYEGLLLEESRDGRVDPSAIARVLRVAALAVGPAAFADERLASFLRRVAFLRRHCPEIGLPRVDDDRVREVLGALCEGRSSFGELRAADLGASVRTLLSREQERAVEDDSPEVLVLPGGRRIRIDYSGEAPFAASRLQDFFGMTTGPRVARGRVPVVLHLLAPNQRAVQITTDLAGFWVRHYPALARELRRRYPKHSFPDDPLRALPPRPR